MVTIEIIRGQQVAHMPRRLQLPANIDAGREHPVGCNRREGPGQVELGSPTGIRAGPLTDDDIPNLDLRRDGPGGADA